MFDTRPKGERTGYSHPGCYAGGLADCDRKLTKEHYVSEKLLKRLGRAFMVAGMSWLPQPRSLTPNALGTKILCKRHNEALSDLDDNITTLFDAVSNWHDGKPVESITLDGEDLERWAIKLWLGHIVSGHAVGLDGESAGVRAMPEEYVRYLFGDTQLKDGCGFYYTNRLAPDANRSGVAFWMHGVAENPNTIFAISISLKGFTFTTTAFCPLIPTVQYRPNEIHLEDKAVIKLRWERRSALASSHETIQLFRETER